MPRARLPPRGTDRKTKTPVSAASLDATCPRCGRCSPHRGDEVEPQRFRPPRGASPSALWPPPGDIVTADHRVDSEDDGRRLAQPAQKIVAAARGVKQNHINTPASR